MKRILATLLCLGLVAVTGFALDQGDYRIWWGRPDGTVLGGFTNDGRLDSLAGITAGGLITATEGLTVSTGQALTLSGTTTLTVGEGAVSFGGTLGVTGLTTLSGGLTVPTDQAVSLDGDTTLTVGIGATTLGGILDVTGATELASTLGVIGDFAVGQTDSRTFTVDASTGNTVITGDLSIEGAVSVGNGMQYEEPLTLTQMLTLEDVLTLETVDSAGVSPQTASVVLYFDGTDLIAMNDAGQTQSLTGAWNE